MRDLLDDIDRWRADGRAVVLARVVDLEGSGPRGPGAAMAVNDRLEVTGSVSGGCVEGALVTAAEEVFRTGERSVHTFGYSDGEAFAVGPTCGQRLLTRVGPSLTPRDAVCVLTHDAKFDVPAIIAALRTEAGYLGVMGSRNTHRDRLERLRSEGVSDAALARLHAPIGLDIGALAPEETAVSICAEIIAERAGLDIVRPLRQVQTPIHH